MGRNVLDDDIVIVRSSVQRMQSLCIIFSSSILSHSLVTNIIKRRKKIELTSWCHLF